MKIIYNKSDDTLYSSKKRVIYIHYDDTKNIGNNYITVVNKAIIKDVDIINNPLINYKYYKYIYTFICDNDINAITVDFEHQHIYPVSAILYETSIFCDNTFEYSIQIFDKRYDNQLLLKTPQGEDYVVGQPLRDIMFGYSSYDRIILLKDIKKGSDIIDYNTELLRINKRNSYDNTKQFNISVPVVITKQDYELHHSTHYRYSLFMKELSLSLMSILPISVVDSIVLYFRNDSMNIINCTIPLFMKNEYNLKSLLQYIVNYTIPLYRKFSKLYSLNNNMMVLYSYNDIFNAINVYSLNTGDSSIIRYNDYDHIKSYIYNQINILFDEYIYHD